METAVLTVSMGVMKPLLSKLTDLLGKEYVKITGVHKKIKFLRDELTTMSATLETLANAERPTDEMKIWRDQLRELAYDIDDYVDTIKDRDDRGRLKGFEGLFAKLFQLKRQHKFANEMAELEERAIEISERHKRYRSAFVLEASSSQSSIIDPRLLWVYEETENLVGIDAPKNHIIRQLGIGSTEGCSTRRQVVSIVGCGGLGKTTLAKQIFDTIKSHFQCASFVSISQSPDYTAILRKIAREVGIPANTSLINGDVLEVINILREHLKDKRYMVVIDDVWNAKHWEFIKRGLPNNDLGSRIITTTRSITVAKCCSSQVHEMESLSFDDSKRLFFRRSFGSEDSCYPHLKDVPDKILKKCGGLPLAIVTLSGILTNELAKAEWDRILCAIGSTLTNKDDTQTMTSILSLSYLDMPHHLRTCLLYLTVYPEDYEIEKQCLITRWIAEGFIHEEKGQSKYETGEDYFNDLINRSMIQPIKVKFGQAKACRVHDIILDYIKCKAIEENFVTLVDAAEPAYTSEYKVRRLCVSNHNDENVTIWEDQILSQVRSVTIFGYPVKISSSPSSLRVLDLGNCTGMEEYHLASMGNLFNLKYLGLVSRLPDNVGELQHLQTLDVRGTCMEELPPTITKLQRLSHLYVDRDTAFPEGTIRDMHTLEELREYGVQSYEQGKSIQEFSKLTKLRTLKIKLVFKLPDGSEGRNQAEDIHNYMGNLLSSCNLHNLYISEASTKMWYPLSLHSWHPAPSCSIRKLCIKELPIYKVPTWMGSLGNLRVLELVIICVRPEDVEILGEVPSLLFLSLVTIGGSSGRIVFPGNSGFGSLKYFSLCIDYCGTSLEFEAGSMPKLEHVKLDFNAHEMECWNGASSLGIQHLSSLNKAEIKIYSYRDADDENYNPAEDNHDDTVRFISRAINAAIQALPNRPTVRFWMYKCKCYDYESALRDQNEYWEGLLDEWLKIWQIREEQANQAMDGETIPEGETHEKEEEERTDKEEETSEKKVVHQDDSGSSN